MLLATIVLLAQTVSPPPPDPPDYLSYIAEVKAAGATEDAQAELLMVAGMMAGETVLEFPKNEETGNYGMKYNSTTCPRPGLSKEELARLRKESDDRIAPILKTLRSVADADHSGFISSKEGSAVRRTFEFGARLSYLAKAEGPDRNRLCKLLPVTPAEFDRQLLAYAAFVKAFSGTPVRYLPPVPTLQPQ